MTSASTVPSSGHLSRTLLALNPRAFWRATLATPWSFRWTCAYIFLEYVRPQQIFTFLQGPPWALACIVLAVLAFAAEGAKFRSRTPINVVFAVFSLLVLASTLAATYPDESLSQLAIYVNWVLAFILLANTATTERRWFIMVVLYLLWNFKMSQHGFTSWASRGFAFASWGVSGSPGWFQNSGEFALQMGMFVPLSIYFIHAVRPFVSKRMGLALWALPITGTASVIASSSRGGYLALALVAIVGAIRSKRRTRNIAILLVLAPVIWLMVPQAQKQRFSNAGEDTTSRTRLLYWERGIEMANEHPLLGVGYANWVPYYREHYYSPNDSLNRRDARGQTKIEVAHNSFIEIISQMGYVAGAVFIMLLALVPVVNARTRNVLRATGARGEFLRAMSRGLDDGIIAFAVAGYFMSVAFYPFVWIQLGLTASLHAAAINLASAKGQKGRAPAKASVQRSNVLAAGVVRSG